MVQTAGGPQEEGLDEGRPKPIGIPSDAPKRGRKKKTLDLSEKTVGAGVCAIFGTVSLVTGHSHWRKTIDKVEPISTPLTEMLNNLPAEILDRIERNACLASLIYGIAIVAGPDIAIEMQARKMMKEGWKPPNVTSQFANEPTNTVTETQSSPGTIVAPPPDLSENAPLN